MNFKLSKIIQPGTNHSFKVLLTYLKTPKSTCNNVLNWVNAKWQLRCCTKVGKLTRVKGKVFVNNMGQITLGAHLLIFSHYARSVLVAFPDGIIEIGDRTFLNYGVDIAATKLVKIGKNCMIGTHAIILDNDFHLVTDFHHRPEPKPVIIGDNVWIGNRVTVLPGVTIGENSVIGAGSVVVKSIPANSVAAGNPAKIIREL